MDFQEEIEHILSLIKNRRKALGITQKQMAEHISLSQNAYKDIEIGKTKLTLVHLFKILEILKIDFSELSLKTITAETPEDEEDIKKLLIHQTKENREIKAMLKKLLDKS